MEIVLQKPNFVRWLSKFVTIVAELLFKSKIRTFAAWCEACLLVLHSTNEGDNVLNFGSSFCPQCKSEVAEERIHTPPIVCDQCGWSEKKNQIIKHQDLQKSTIKIFLIFSFILIALYFHTLKWGEHSLAVIPLKFSQWLGQTSASQAKSMAKICAQRQQVQCVIDTYSLLVKSNPRDPEAFSLLATTLEKAKRGGEAIPYYSRYFALGGNDSDLAYNFARLLEEKQDYENAIQYYEYVINLKPDIFQITVSKNYVNLLIKTRQFNKAKIYIKTVRKKGQNAPLFMDNELNVIASYK